MKDNKFTFVCCKGWSSGIGDRGGVDILISAFKTEFKKEEPVRLLIKINSAYNSPNWNLANEINKLNLNLDAGAELLVSADNINYKNLSKLIYNKGDCFVLPTRGEAFGLTIAEAMACELPVIVTGTGGHTDFVKDKYNGLYIDYKLEEVRNNFMYEGINWAMPDIEDVKRKMRWAFNNKDKLKNMGKNARKTMVDNFQWKHCGLKAQKAIEKLWK